MTKKSAMRVLVLDPGYGHRNAHHHSVNVALVRDLAMSKVEVLTVASAELTAEDVAHDSDQGLASLPWFGITRYPENAETLPLADHERLAHAFAAEVVALFDQQRARPDDICLLHTGFAFHFHGLAIALWRLQGRAGGRWIVLTMFAPGSELSPSGDEHPALDEGRTLLRYRLALKLLASASQRTGVQVMLASPTRAYQRSYQQLWPGPVMLHPAVNYRPLEASLVAAGDARFTVLLYLGCPKSDKGIEFALRLGTAAAAHFPQMRFLFHFNAEFFGAERYLDRVAALQRAGEKHANVAILRGNLTPQQYDVLLRDSDMLCLLYDPAHYRIKTSGTFWDGLRCTDLAWLVTSGSWMQRELIELEIPHAAVPFGDVASALRGLEQHWRQGKGDRAEISPEALDYRRRLCRPLGEWILEALAT